MVRFAGPGRRQIRVISGCRRDRITTGWATCAAVAGWCGGWTYGGGDAPFTRLNCPLKPPVDRRSARDTKETVNVEAPPPPQDRQQEAQSPPRPPQAIAGADGARALPRALPREPSHRPLVL